MINSRDSYNEYDTNKKEVIEVPYRIGTILELKENPYILAKICQYRITVDGLITVGLNYSIIKNEDISENLKSTLKTPQKFVAVEFTNIVDFEISTEKLEEQWQKTSKMIINKISSSENIGNNLYTRKRKKYDSLYFY